MSFHALHYSHPGHPVLFRFASAAERQAWIDDHPSFRRAIAPPRHDPGGWLAGPVTVSGFPMLVAQFRTAEIDDLVTPPDDLAQRMIDRIRKPVSDEFDRQADELILRIRDCLPEADSPAKARTVSDLANRVEFARGVFHAFNRTGKVLIP